MEISSESQQLEIKQSQQFGFSNLIISTPETCGGKPRLAGTRMAVQNLAIDYKNGMTAEEIAQEYPHLSLGQIYLALAYYHLNKCQIEADIEEYYTECQKWEKEHEFGKI